MLVWAAAALAGCHPDLVAASVSGMEVPLAALIGECRHFGCRAGESQMARDCWEPLRWAPVRRQRCLRRLSAAVLGPATAGLAAVALSGAAMGGALLSMGLLGLRNYAVSGMALPATFHAKVSVAAPVRLLVQVEDGFRGLLGQFPLMGSISRRDRRRESLDRPAVSNHGGSERPRRGRDVRVGRRILCRVVRARAAGRSPGFLPPALRASRALPDGGGHAAPGVRSTRVVAPPGDS